VSEYVAWSTVAYYQSIIHECLRACGHSPDLVQFVIGYADAGQEIIRNVDKVTFIGSPAVGKMVCLCFIWSLFKRQ
jgi:aldehyde dehydrogenase (NAD+)